MWLYQQLPYVEVTFMPVREWPLNVRSHWSRFYRAVISSALVCYQYAGAGETVHSTHYGMYGGLTQLEATSAIHATSQVNVARTQTCTFTYPSHLSL